MYYLTTETLIPIKHYPQHYRISYSIIKRKRLNTIVNIIINKVFNRYGCKPAFYLIKDKLFKYGYISINHYRFNI
jgi:hypothetical protein